jgi:hypothetical protein
MWYDSLIKDGKTRIYIDLDEPTTETLRPLLLATS